MQVLRESNLPLRVFKKGKVRDVYDLGEKLLIVCTDRISAFDVVLPTPIPYKGIVLNKLSEFWFKYTEDIAPNHMISTKLEDLPEEVREDRSLEGRCMVVKKVKPIPLECTVRGYLYGSAWEEYKKTGSLWDIKVPANLKLADKLPEPLFTPTTKEEVGHDRPLRRHEAKEMVGEEIFTKVEEISLRVYERASAHAERRGIIIADTKMEFGIYDGEIILIDELLTPDSSRFWPADGYEPGKPQPSFDKQYVRDYLESIGWNKQPPAPELPADVVRKTSEKYLEALNRLVM